MDVEQKTKKLSTDLQTVQARIEALKREVAAQEALAQRLIGALSLLAEMAQEPVEGKEAE